MRVFTLCCCVALLAGCSKPEQQAAQDSTAAMAMPAAISLADVAGTWTVSSMAPGSDSVLLTYSLTASADPAAWSFTFPGRDPIPVRSVMADGDSIVAEAGPFESGIRAGVEVSTRTVMRLENGELIGMTVGHYEGGGADSVMTFQSRGVRAQ